MLPFLADENLNNNIVRGVWLRDRSIPIVRAVDAGLTGIPDSQLLQFAADAGLIVLSHDVSTLTRYAYERVEGDLPMPGVIEIPIWLPIGTVIDELLLIAGASTADDWEGQVRYLPIR